jgi:glycerophosphoryl diester phosphodiesterase
VVETDCWLSRDGGLVCLHDATLDRTTTGSGPTHDLTLPGALVLEVDAGRWFTDGWPNTLRVPAFTDVLDEVGGRTLLSPEAKNVGAGRVIAALLARYGLQETAIVQSFIQAELGPAIADGVDMMILTATSAYDPAALSGAGIRYLGLSAALPASLVAPARANGLEVVVWTVDRRVDMARWLAAGAVGFFSDDPLYVAGRSPVLARDPFGQHTYYHGHLASAVARDRGTFHAPDAWGYADTGPAYKGALQGWACPVHGAADADAFTLTLTVDIDAATSPMGWAGAFLCAADDMSFDDAGEYAPGLCGYHVLLRQSGALEIHVVEHGIGRPAAAAATPPVEPGDPATLRIDVTRGQVAVSRVDLLSPVNLGVADAGMRGGYLDLGRRAAAVRFSRVTID